MTVDEDALELLIASASEAGLTTMMLFLTCAQARRLAVGLLGAVYETIDGDPAGAARRRTSAPAFASD